MKYPLRLFAATRSAIQPPPNVPAAPAARVVTPKTTFAPIALMCFSSCKRELAQVAKAPSTKDSAVYPPVDRSQLRVLRIRQHVRSQGSLLSSDSPAASASAINAGPDVRSLSP